MSDAVIVAAVRSAIGKKKGALANTRADDLLALTSEGARRARQGRPAGHRGRRRRLRHADRRAGLQHRAHRGADGRLPHRDHRHHRQSSVRLVAAGVPLRRAGRHVGRRWTWSPPAASSR